MDNAIGNLSSLRVGAHYTLKLESFSLYRNAKIENYESRSFEIGGYKWKLSLYPNGNKKRNVTDHVSFYLGMVDTGKLPLGWEVNVVFNFCVFDQIRDKYVIIQADEWRVRRFHTLKNEWGFHKFLHLDTLTNASNGYLVDDCCIFGAEVFVVKYSGKGDCVSIKKDPLNNTFSWKIQKFSTIFEEKITSQEFVVGDLKWKLSLYPKGYGTEKGKSMSLFLQLADSGTLPPEWKVYVEYKLRLRNHLILDKSVEKEAKYWFCASIKGWGCPDFMTLSDLNNAFGGWLVNDSIIVEAQITLISYPKDL